MQNKLSTMWKFQVKMSPQSKVVSLVCLLLQFSYFVDGFNLETRIPIIKRGQQGSYFGFSVAEHVEVNVDSNNVSWLLVGAPLGKNLQPETNRSGALWKCPMTTSLDDCEQIITDGRRYVGSDGPIEKNKSLTSDELSPPHKDEIKENQWLGVSLSSKGPGGKVVVCAHRYIRVTPNGHLGQGLCYILDNNLLYDNIWEPCRGKPLKWEYQYSYCQAGASAALLENGMLLLGVPGVYNWRGSIFFTGMQNDFLERRKTPYFGPHTEDTSPVKLLSYLGMSVTGGRYFGANVSYAAGAPRSDDIGEVVIYTKNVIPPFHTADISKILKGEQMTSNFGYEMATGDFNGDGKADLVVSAPFYFSATEGGAVYIYINQNYSFSDNYTLRLTGKPESRFGIALANAGDMNKDSCDDLAVGSPYEGNGVVYIYLGSKAAGLDREPKQIIRAESLPSLMPTFGYSLSGGLDMDGNGYPDLLVGAYDDSSVALLRGRPIVDIKTSIRPSEALKNIDPSKNGCPDDREAQNTCFSFQACCSIESLIKSSSAERLTLNYVIEAETFAGGNKFSRVFFNSSGNKRSNIIKRTINLMENSRQNCENHIVYIKENTRDIQTPIKFNINYTLVAREPRWSSSGPLPSVEGLPILNATQASRVFQAELMRDCGDDDICISDLKVSAALLLPKSAVENRFVLTLGEEEELHLKVLADNYGESAYEAHLFIQHHPGLNYIAANVTDKHSSCSLFNKTIIACSLGNPFKRQVSGGPRPIILRFDPKVLEDHEAQLDFLVWANSTSKEKQPGRPPLRVVAMVIKNAELTIKGSARPEQVFYGGSVKGESAMEYLDDIGSRVLHTYQVFNLGPWRVNYLDVHLEWPHQVANNKPQGKWLLYPEGMPTVEAAGGGYCEFISPSRSQPASQSQYVNPLGLGLRPGAVEPPLDNLLLMQDTPTVPAPVSASTRQRRDAEMVVRPEAYTDKDGVRQTVVHMNCRQSTAKCIKFQCRILRLSRNQEATIKMWGRLWNSSLVEDYPRVARVSITSHAHLRLPDNYNQTNFDDDSATVETVAYPELAAASPSGVPLWLIILAVLAGLLLLVLLVLALWRLGFFKRRRPDPTLSGNLDKHHEGSPFLGKAL